MAQIAMENLMDSTKGDPTKVTGKLFQAEIQKIVAEFRVEQEKINVTTKPKAKAKTKGRGKSSEASVTEFDLSKDESEPAAQEHQNWDGLGKFWSAPSMKDTWDDVEETGVTAEEYHRAQQIIDKMNMVEFRKQQMAAERAQPKGYAKPKALRPPPRSSMWSRTSEDQEDEEAATEAADLTVEELTQIHSQNPEELEEELQQAEEQAYANFLRIKSKARAARLEKGSAAAEASSSTEQDWEKMSVQSQRLL